MDFLEVRSGNLEWIDLAEERSRWLVLVNAVMSLQIA
jgi:hypothetical protein